MNTAGMGSANCAPVGPPESAPLPEDMRTPQEVWDAQVQEELQDHLRALDRSDAWRRHRKYVHYVNKEIMPKLLEVAEQRGLSIERLQLVGGPEVVVVDGIPFRSY